MNRTKQLGLSMLALLCCILVTAQTSVTKGEYWFDQQYDSRQTFTLTGGVWNQQVDVSHLDAGLHALSIRVSTDDNRWGSVLSKYFIKPQFEGTESALARYEYWIDQQFDKKVTGTFAAGGIIDCDLELPDLPLGLHAISFRAIDNNGQASPVVSKYFIIPRFEGAESTLAKYEYWIDQQYDEKVTGTFAEGGIINCDLELPALTSGLHAISFRAIDNNGQASPVVSKYFIVPQVDSSEENAVTAYRYWIDDEEAIEGAMEAGGVANIERDITSLSRGLHRVSYQVKDKFNRYSSVCTSFFMVGFDASATNQIVAYEYWFNDQPRKRVEVEAANVVTIDEEISIENVEPETVLADYQFDVENKQVIFTHDVLFSFRAINNAGVGTETLTEIIKDYKSVMDIPFTALSLEKENKAVAPVGNKIQGYQFSCQIEDKVYWFVKAESQHVDFYDAEGNLLIPEKEMVGEDQAWVITAPTSTIYVLTYGAESVDAEDVIRVAQPIEIAFENSERAYGDENPTFTYVTERPDLLVGTPVGMTEATVTSGIGDYTITLDPTSISNSMVTVTDATLTVNKAPLTIKAKDYTIKQGEALPALEIEYEGFKNEETQTVLTTQAAIATEATSASEPGAYDITVSGAEAANYVLTFVKGTLTIADADPVTVTANSYEIVYGDALPTFEFGSEGAALVGTPAIVCDVPEGAPAGTYPIVISKGNVTNYNDTYVNGTLTIKKAMLTITADDIEVHQDEVMPTLTWKAEGWKNDEDESVLTVQPVCTTKGSPTSSLGDYTITIGGAEAANYDITYVNGKLTVSVPVGITSIDANVAPADIYTLQGIKVRSKSESLDGLADGYYIVNRRKVLIRRR